MWKYIRRVYKFPTQSERKITDQSMTVKQQRLLVQLKHLTFAPETRKDINVWFLKEIQFLLYPSFVIYQNTLFTVRLKSESCICAGVVVQYTGVIYWEHKTNITIFYIVPFTYSTDFSAASQIYRFCKKVRSSLLLFAAGFLHKVTDLGHELLPLITTMAIAFSFTVTDFDH